MSVLEAVLDGLLVVDREQRVELINTAACRILGSSAEAIRGAPIDRALGADHPVVRLVRAVLREGRAAVENELRLAPRGAHRPVVDVAVSPLLEPSRPPAAGPEGVVVVLRDRTIQKSLEAHVSERERLTAFGQIAAGIAHEVKNPLGGIRGAAEIIGARTEDAKTRDAAQLVVREVDRITALVDDFMVFSRGEDPAFAPLNIHRVLEDVLDLCSMDPVAAGIGIQRTFDPSIPELLGDADRLAQVFLNLIRNALQAMEGSGELTISTRMTIDHRLSTPGGRPLPTLLISVADSGPGIPPEILDQLSTPFFTTRAAGTGLGLAVSRHWVARHGGTLRIESRVGEGTRVHVALPLRRPETRRGAGPAESQP